MRDPKPGPRPGPKNDRRTAVAYADHFVRQAAKGQHLSPTEAFRYAYRTNLWGGSESPSGPGSSLDQTVQLQQTLPELFRRLGVRTLLDLPCGDGHWMAAIALPGIRYVGADLLPEVVARAAAQSSGREFLELDLTTGPLPSADLLLCRDFLVHLSFSDIERAIANIRRSGITYLLATDFPDEPTNRDAITGDWRPLNFEQPPFGFPRPIEVLREGCTEQEGLFADKSLALWRVADLPRSSQVFMLCQ
jgi:SAM-dependent methyltransferase